MGYLLGYIEKFFIVWELKKKLIYLEVLVFCNYSLIFFIIYMFLRLLWFIYFYVIRCILRIVGIEISKVFDIWWYIVVGIYSLSIFD